MLSILGEKLRWRKRNKTVTKSTHKYRQNHWGVELKPQLHMRRRVLPLHLRRVTESPPSPRKFSMNIQANTDFRSYQYAGLPCNAAPQFKAPWEGLMFKFLTRPQIIFSGSQLLARCKIKCIFLMVLCRGIAEFPLKISFFLIVPILCL